ncbi:hypothetical protein HK100_000685, partial [Physocladia obscura]
MSVNQSPYEKQRLLPSIIQQPFNQSHHEYHQYPFQQQPQQQQQQQYTQQQEEQYTQYSPFVAQSRLSLPNLIQPNPHVQPEQQPQQQQQQQQQQIQQFTFNHNYHDRAATNREFSFQNPMSPFLPHITNVRNINADFPLPHRPQNQCVNCGTYETSVWRKDEYSRSICNACGLYKKQHGHDRPASFPFRKSVVRRRRRGGKKVSSDGVMDVVGDGIAESMITAAAEGAENETTSGAGSAVESW